MNAGPVPVDTKTRILDAAEKLFGNNGFEATSLRDITAGAQVNLAAVNYHFQTKESLVDAVIARRLQPVNQRRFQMLEAAGPEPTVEQIVEAFMAPILVLEVSAVPLIGRVLANPEFLERVYKKRLSPVVERFSQAIGQALPELPGSERFWRLHFMAGAMTHVLALSAVLPAMVGTGGGLDREAVMKMLVAFLSAGLRAPAVTGEVVTQGVAAEAPGDQELPVEKRQSPIF